MLLTWMDVRQCWRRHRLTSNLTVSAYRLMVRPSVYGNIRITGGKALLRECGHREKTASCSSRQMPRCGPRPSLDRVLCEEPRG
jgi:hypothetical protein